MLDDYPIAWSFHANTVRWEHNVLSPTAESSDVPYFKEYPGSEMINLPDVQLPDASLNDLLHQRHSCRLFAQQKMSKEALATMLRAGYGIIDKTLLQQVEFFERPVPSGGGLYPLEIYLIANNVEGVKQGIYHYSVPSHALELVRDVALPKMMISNLFMNQPYINEASVIFMITAVVQRNMWKYADRGYRYILFEAGHVAQNINLAALALGAGTLNLGGFFDEQVAQLLNIDISEEIPLYAIAAGYPDATSEKNDLRLPAGLMH